MVRGGGVGVAFGSRLTVGGMNGAGPAWLAAGTGEEAAAEPLTGSVAAAAALAGEVGGGGQGRGRGRRAEGDRLWKSGRGRLAVSSLREQRRQQGHAPRNLPIANSNAPVRLRGKKRRLPESGDRSGSIVRDHRQLR